MNRYRTAIYIVALLCMANLVACGDSGKKDAAADKQGEVMPVEVALPVVDTITLEKTYPGFLSANTVVDVVCQVNGRLLSKNYNSGDYVKKGQVLFTVESTTYRNAVTEAEAQLATARSSYDYYSRQYEAMQKALKADAVSQMDVIQSKSNMDKAHAAISEAAAALETARTNLGYCTITAPISGYIGSASFDVGNYLAGAASPVNLATIYDSSKMVAIFSVEDSQYEKMLGNRADTASIMLPLSFSAPLPHDYVARLYYVDVTVNKATGTLSLKAHVDNPYNELKNDMFVTVTLPYGTTPDAILVKDASISTDQAGKYLYTVNDKNQVVYTPIEVGDIYQDSLRVVTKGITPSTRYVTSALLKVRDGMEVKPVLTR